jgi:hypothetical protein
VVIAAGAGVLFSTVLVAPVLSASQNGNDYVQSLARPEPVSRMVEDAVEVESPDRDYRCSVRTVTETAEFGDHLPSVETPGWYLGALLVPDDAEPSGFRLVSGPARNPVTVNLDTLPMDPATPPTARMDVVGAGEYQQRHRQLVDRALAHMAGSGTRPAANLRLSRFSSVDGKQLGGHLGSAFGVRFIARLEGTIDWERTDILSRTVVELTQEYYSTTVDPIGPMDRPFAEEVSREQVEPLVSSAPVYISSVRYGRKAVLVYESTYSGSEVQKALDAYVRSQHGKLSAELSRTDREIMETARIHGFVLGGSGSDAATALVDRAGLDAFVTGGSEFSAASPGAAISYELRHLDGSTAVADHPVTYRTRDCQRVGQRVDVELTRVTMLDVDDGPLDDDAELFGLISAEGVDGRHPVFDRPRAQHITVEAGRSWESLPGNHRTTVRVRPAADGALTIRAELSESDGDGDTEGLGVAELAVPFRDGWYGEHSLEVLMDGTDLRLTFVLTPVHG